MYRLLRNAEIIGEKGVRGEVARLTGLSDSCVQKYAEAYLAGLEDQTVKISDFLGKSGKGVGSSPVRYLHMMGVLDRKLSPED